MSTNNKGEKQLRILEAAVKAFSEKGYHGSSIADVAQEAGVATGTIYLYFERKEDLLVKLFQRFLGGYLAGSRPLVLAEPAGVARLRRLVELQLRFFERDRELASVFQIHLREPDEVIRAGIHPTLVEYFELIESVVVSGVECGDFAADIDPRLARRVLFGALDEVVTSWVVSKRGYPLMPLLDPVCRMLSRALGAHDAVLAATAREEAEA